MLEIDKRVACSFVFGLLLVLVQPASGAERISRLGEYVGYSTEQYDGWQRSSQYVTVRDGTRIAIDYFRPTLANELHSEKLPVLFTTTRYQRAGLIDGRLLTVIDQMPYLVRAIKHGYVIAIADVRGSGASFGKKLGFFPPEEARDSYDVIEWLARQDWSSGKVGMFSQSYLGTTQMFAASASPPSLKAIFPEVAWLDTYASFYPGGIFKIWPVYNWSTFVRTADFVAPLPPDWRAMMKAADETKTVSEAPLDCELSFCTNPGGTSATPVVPVDEDVDGRLLAEATAEHRQGDWNTFQLVRAVPYRDSKVAGMDIPLSEERSVYSVLEEIKSSGIPAYHYGGWFDGFSRDTPLLYRSWPNSKKLIMGPWYHGGFRKEILETEYLRWFDYWLKGIDNGVMDEDAVHYYLMGAADGAAWRSSKTWPLPNEQRSPFYFSAGQSGSIDSVNDGVLDRNNPVGGGMDKYHVDYSTTLSVDNRHTLTFGGAAETAPPYAGMALNDRKGLTYSTSPLVADTEVTGYAVAHLWVSTTAEDGDFFVYLEEVLPDGTSQFVSDGMLRASHRKLGEAPYDNADLPYHPSNAADVAMLTPNMPVELVIELSPTSRLFKRGNRIRVTITCADANTFETPVVNPVPEIALYRSEMRPSRIVLPIIK